MPSPGYLWMTDSQGNHIKSTVQVKHREGSAEVHSFHHEIYIPTDEHTGHLSGTRKHTPFTIIKPFCSATPILNKACCSGQNLKEIKLSWYRIDDTGKEQEYLRQTLTNAKVVCIKPIVSDVKDKSREHYGHLESVSFRYEKIHWIYLDGNISAEDTWTDRS